METAVLHKRRLDLNPGLQVSVKTVRGAGGGGVTYRRLPQRPFGILLLTDRLYLHIVTVIF